MRMSEKALSLEDGPEYWEKRWAAGEIQWHSEKLNSFLGDHILDLTDKRQNLRILVPLCGKAVDIKWLADQGHCVVGIEFSLIAVESFFAEWNLEFTKETVKGIDAVVFKATTVPITLYCCDMFAFKCGIEEPFDAIWDRGSLVAIPRAERLKYVELIKSLLKPNGRILLECYEYDEKFYDGPPCSLLDDAIKKLFDDSFQCQKLVCEEDVARHKRAPASDFFNICLWLFVHKMNFQHGIARLAR